MLLYLVVFYVLFRIIYFAIGHKGQDRQTLGKMIMFLVLEIVLVIAGIMAVVPVIFGGIGDNTALAYTMLIGGVICLIASGRVGMYIRKLGLGTGSEVSNINPIGKKQLMLAKTLTALSFIAYIFAWPFYQALFKSWAALIYAVCVVCAIFAIRFANKSRSVQGVKKSTVWSLIIFSCLLAVLSGFMLLGIASK